MCTSAIFFLHSNSSKFVQNEAQQVRTRDSCTKDISPPLQAMHCQYNDYRHEYRPTMNWGNFEHFLVLYINCQKIQKFSRNSAAEKCTFLYLSVKYLIYVANRPVLFQQIVLCSMLPPVMGNFEHRSKWLVLYVSFELPITYNNRRKGKIKGIIFNPSKSLKYQVAYMYFHLTDRFIFYLFFLFLGGVVEHMYGVILNTKIRSNFEHQSSLRQLIHFKKGKHPCWI